MAWAFPNNVRFQTATVGTGTISVGAAIAGFQTPGTAGVVSGSTVPYGILDGTAWEIGVGTFASGAISRDAVEASSASGAKLALSGSATVYIGPSGGLFGPLTDNKGRSKLINGLFRIGQRGSGPWTTNLVFTADRWLLNFSGDTPSVTIAALTDAHRQNIGDEEATNGLSTIVTSSGAAGSFTALIQRIEDLRRLAGKTVTLSFYAIASVAGLKIGASIDQSFGTGGSPSASVQGAGSSVTLTTSFARYAITFAVPTSSGKVLGSNADHYQQLNLWLSAGTTNATRSGAVGVQSGTVTIFGVQLEVGSVATPLEKPEYSFEMNACQRFYSVGSGTVGFYSPSSGTTWWTPLNFAVQMRATPTVAVTASGGNNYSSVTGSANGGGGLNLVCTTSALGAAGGYNYAYTATAEL